MTDLAVYTEMDFGRRHQEAQRARERAQRQLAEVLANEGEVARVADSLRTHRLQNALGERMRLAYMAAVAGGNHDAPAPRTGTEHRL